MQFTIFHVILMTIAFFIIIITMLQDSKSDGASGALMGGGLHLFNSTKERGLVKSLTKTTMYLGVAYIIITIFIKMA